MQCDGSALAQGSFRHLNPNIRVVQSEKVYVFLPQDVINFATALEENAEKYSAALRQWNVEYGEVLRDEVLTPLSSPDSSIGFRRTASESVLGNRRKRYLSTGFRESREDRLHEDGGGGYFDLSSSPSSRGGGQANDFSSFSLSSYGEDYDGFEEEPPT